MRAETMIIVMAVIGVLLLFGIVGYAAYKERAEWENFRVEHNCKMVDTFPISPDIQGWECDDGETYYK